MTKQQLIRLGSLIFIVALVLVSLLVVNSLFMKANMDQGLPVVVTVEEFLSVKGENTLLKKMLGQMEGKIILLGPVGKNSQLQGKLVWDKTLQQGFLHLSGLEPAMSYSLILITKDGVEITAAQLTTTDSLVPLWQVQFSVPQRILNLAVVEIRTANTSAATEMTTYARGVLPEN
ncbi:MAG: hypothetical protein SH807_00370 [Blastochloris sp.]|nr:hypothetical protein [Blastochloris sp.]